MTQEQAIEIREHLVSELNKYGFSDVVTEVHTRLEEDYEEGDFKKEPHSLLVFFLKESIEVLENLSNKNFPELIKRLNRLIEGDMKIETVKVELLDNSKKDFYDLKDLPNYDKITTAFREILNEIGKN